MTASVARKGLRFEVYTIGGQWLLLFIIFSAALLRFYKLGEWSFWIEEHHTLRHVTALNLFEAAGYRPVFFLLSKPFLAILGINEWSARFLPVLIGISTIPILYWVTKQISGTLVATLATLLLAISPWHIYWSQNARFYTLLLLLFSVAAFAFYWGIEHDNFRAILAAGLLLGIALATSGIAILLLPVFVLYFLLLKLLPFGRPPGLRWRNLAPFFVVPLVGYLLFDGYRVLYQGQVPIPLDVYRKFFAPSTASFVGLANPYVLVTAVVHPTGTPVALLAALGSFLLLSRRSRIGLFCSLAAFLPLGTLMGLTPFASVSNRYVFMALFFWLLLAALGIKEIAAHTQKQRLILLIPLAGFALLFLRDPTIDDVRYYLGTRPDFGLFLALLLGGWLIGAYLLWRQAAAVTQRGSAAAIFILLSITLLHAGLANKLYYHYEDGHRENWAAATALIRAERAENDAVIAAMYTMGTYYLNENVRDIQTVNLATILQENQRAWFIEDEFMQIVMGHQFAQWATNHCTVVGNWDRYDTGRIQKMRVHRCEAPPDQ